MDIEKLIEQLKSLEACAYGYHINGEVLGMNCSDFEQVMVDAADEIANVPTLQAENKKLRAELEQVKRERDVAIEQLHGHCPACAHYTPNHNEGPCQFCCFEIARGTNVEINDNWKWRGPKEE